MAQRRKIVLVDTDTAGIVRTSDILLDSVVPAKVPLRVSTTAALPANTRSGNILTASANGVFPAQDGITLVLNDRILVQDEATGANNGLFTITDLGSAGTPWVLTRSIDADEGTKIMSQMTVRVEEGTTLGGRLFTLTTPNPITLNTTALTFKWKDGDDYVRTVTTTPVTLSKTDRTVVVDAAGGNATINLPAAATAPHRIYHVKKKDSSANTVTIDPNSTETIDGVSTHVLTAQHQSVTFQSDGTEWWIF